MRTITTIRWMALAGVIFAAACGDDDKAPVAVATSDAGAPADGGSASGPPADGGAAAIPITVWVTDLVVKFGPMSAPDTVDDKVLMDTEDPAAFDSLIQ